MFIKSTLLISIVVAITSPALAQKKALVTASFPSEMAPQIQAQYKQLWEKGQILYGINCARCHNSIVRRRELIPDFSADQLKGYEIRVLNKEHEANMPDELVTAEELVLISTFLQYKNKTGLAVRNK